MPTRIGIYVVSGDPKGFGYIVSAICSLNSVVDHLLIVGNKTKIREIIKRSNIEGFEIDYIDIEIETSEQIVGYKIGLSYIEKNLKSDIESIILTGSDVIINDKRLIQIHNEENSKYDLFSSYFRRTELNDNLESNIISPILPLLEFFICRKKSLIFDEFWRIWDTVESSNSNKNNIADISEKIADFIENNNLQISYDIDSDAFYTIEPRLMEFHKLVESGCVALPISVFHLDPLVHDLNAIDIRTALDQLKESNVSIYNDVIEYVCKSTTLREFHAIGEEVRIIDNKNLVEEKYNWLFGEVGIFIHAYYADMIDEFWQLIEKIPGEYCLYISVATQSDKEKVEEYLYKRGVKRKDMLVRVLENNRGRDMSALFITFRDIILQNKHEVALRIHSKKTPQVSKRVAESFKLHLFNNLLNSKAYVVNLFNFLEENRNVGLAMPPTIHIGFGTLGHSWFNNRANVEQLANEMGLEVTLDHSTPLAPYGTMFWFRTAALKKMFEHAWRWEDYNAEPMHVDGGLAHAQERLIPYVVQDAGFRVVSIMNPEDATRNYAKLEYKLQRLASLLPTANIIGQVKYLQNDKISKIRIIRLKMSKYYRKYIVSRPRIHRIIRPLARPLGRIWQE